MENSVADPDPVGCLCFPDYVSVKTTDPDLLLRSDPVFKNMIKTKWKNILTLFDILTSLFVRHKKRIFFYKYLRDVFQLFSVVADFYDPRIQIHRNEKLYQDQDPQKNNNDP